MTVSSPPSKITLSSLKYTLHNNVFEMEDCPFLDQIKKQKNNYANQLEFKTKKNNLTLRRGTDELYLKLLNKILDTSYSLEDFRKFSQKNKDNNMRSVASFNPKRINDSFNCPDPLTEAEEAKLRGNNQKKQQIPEIKQVEKSQDSSEDEESESENDETENPDNFLTNLQNKISYGGICSKPKTIESPGRAPVCRRILNYEKTYAMNKKERRYSTDITTPRVMPNSPVKVERHKKKGGLCIAVGEKKMKTCDSLDSIINPNSQEISSKATLAQKIKNVESNNSSDDSVMTDPDAEKSIKKLTKAELKIMNHKSNNDDIESSKVFQISGSHNEIKAIQDQLLSILGLSPKVSLQKIVFQS